MVLTKKYGRIDKKRGVSNQRCGRLHETRDSVLIKKYGRLDKRRGVTSEMWQIIWTRDLVLTKKYNMED